MRLSRARSTGLACCLMWIASAVLSIALTAQDAGVHPISGRRIAPVMGYQGADWLERRKTSTDARQWAETVSCSGLKPKPNFVI